MARKNDKTDPADDATTQPDPADDGAGAVEEAQELIDTLRRENTDLRAQVEALTRERDTAMEASRLNAEEYAKTAAAAQARRERHDAPLLRVLRRASEKAQKAGDGATHQALEHVLVTLAEARHRVKEGIKSARGDGLHLLEDLEELLD